LGKGRRAGEMVETVEAFEETMGSRAAGMHDTFGDPFMVKVGDLLAEDEILELRRPDDSRLERGLVDSNQLVLVCGQRPLGWRRAILVQGPILVLTILDRPRSAGLGITVSLAQRTGCRELIEDRRHRARRRRTGSRIFTGFGV